MRSGSVISSHDKTSIAISVSETRFCDSGTFLANDLGKTKDVVAGTWLSWGSDRIRRCGSPADIQKLYQVTAWSMNRYFYPIQKTISKSTTYLFEQLFLKRLARPDVILRSTFNTMEATPERVISNFLQGTFLLGNLDDNGLVWRSYPERAIITPQSARIQRRLRQYMDRSSIEIRSNEQFDVVIESCRREENNWVNDDVIEIYSKLYEMGYVKTLEAYDGEDLVAGMWGLMIGRVFSIMSMFHHTNRSGSILFGHMVDHMEDAGMDLIDCGAMSSNFKRFGAQAVSNEKFIQKVVRGMQPVFGVKKQGGEER